MGKRITIFLVLILICGLVVMGYFLSQGRKSFFTDPYKSVSPDAAFIIETEDLQSFMNSLTTGKGLFGELGNVKELGNFSNHLKFITDQLNKPAFKNLTSERTVIISFHSDSKGKLRSILSMALAGKLKYRQIKEILRSSGISDVLESKEYGNELIKIPYLNNNQKDTVYLSVVSGLLMCSSTPELIKKSIAQTESGSDVRSLPDFSKVQMAAGKNEDKLFVIFSNLPGIFRNLLSKESGAVGEKLGRLAGAAEGDIFINEDGLVMSGFTESTDSTDILYKYKDISPKEFHTYKILPSATVLFETLALPSAITAGVSFRGLDQRAVDLGLKLRAYAGEEITQAYINIRDNAVADNTLIIYELANRIQAEHLFVNYTGSESETLYFQPDDQTKIPVYKTAFKGLTSVLLPGYGKTFNDTYFAFYDNFLVAGSSFKTISRLLYDNMLNKTLANDLTYRDFEESLPSRAGYFLYCVPSRIIEYLSGILDNDVITALKTNKGSLNKIQAAGYQLASSNGMIYNSISVRFKEKAREESTTEWETLLDTVAAIKPFFFTNHNTGAKEIFIQDVKNNTYLINAAGRVLWKVPVNERIVGTIYMIDYYKNGKYQLLFSGRNYLHMLDRNGNYVERYPVKLRSPATNSLALFDYDNNLTYRLFIAGEDKLIYSYDKTGNTVKGWKPFRTLGTVKAEINYFKVSGKDFLVAADDKSIYFIDRRGNQRIVLKEPVTKAVGSAIRLIPGSKPSVVCSTPDGTVLHIYFDGSIKKVSLRKFSPDHSFDVFDIDGDGFNEYIFIDKGILYLYDHNNSEMFERDFGSDELGGPIDFIFSASDRMIGVFNAEKKLIYLIDKNGETMNGFPLKGASMFSIGKLSGRSGWHLIVGGTDRFLYNYKIDPMVK